MSCSVINRMCLTGAFALVSIVASQTALAQNENIKEVAVIETDHGEILIEMWPDVAPKTVENFKKLAGEKFYDGTAFHRIMKDFMIQGGDPKSKDDSLKAEWGTGDPGYKIDAEFSDKEHVRGVISMARGPDVNSAGSQFFICHGDAKFLDGQYTAFGKLVGGDDVLEKIATSPTVQSGEKSKPVDRINLKSIKFEEREIQTEDK